MNGLMLYETSVELTEGLNRLEKRRRRRLFIHVLHENAQVMEGSSHGKQMGILLVGRQIR